MSAFGLAPEFDLDIMKTGQSLSQLTSRLLVRLEDHFTNHRPDLVLAHGDTTTCFTTAISSFYHQIPFFHVEAGLRTYRLNSPFPEEFNRQTIAPIAHHHFAPTYLEKENLLKDGISASQITVTGSTVHEAVQSMMSLANPHHSQFPFLTDSRPLVVVTLHRRESAQSLKGSLHGLRSAATECPDAIFICPVHPNPSVQDAFRNALSGLKNVIMTDAMEYPQFVSLLMRAQLVVTDSGGVQEEASYLGKKVLLARNETERADGFESGLVRLVGSDSENIRQAVLFELSTKTSALPLSPIKNFQASALIANEVERALA